MKCIACIGLLLGVTTVHAMEPVSFEREVLPLLELRCNKCHHEGEQSGGLDLTRLATMHRGGDELGAAIVPAKPGESPLIGVLTGAAEPAMPENSDPLPEKEIELLRRWIAEGANDDTTVFPADDVAFFEREIRPVLVQRCFKCHAGDEPEHGLRLTSRQGILDGGARGSAAIVGKPDASLIMNAIRHDGELQMPRGGDKLSDTQIAAFSRWIDKGLPWPADNKVLAREKHFTISDADRDHWAFRPLPRNLPSDWSIDATLKPHHQRLGLSPPKQADKYRLLRRVTYDLIGYPPTPDEITALEQDSSPDAYTKVVDRLLQSPRFGWRWGRHWLDYTRSGANGQSNRGPEMDPDRYAAWVAKCVNEDRPYDWFARVHLAGDRMPTPDGANYSIDQAIAAAVPLNGPRTFARAETDTFVLMDKLDEGVEFLGRSLLGISLECARCHDHKFDPISQHDYYALLGIFQSSWFGPVPADTPSPADADAVLAHYRGLLRERARLEGLIRTTGTRKSITGGQLRKQWYEQRQAFLTPKEKRVVELEVAILEAEFHTIDEEIRRELEASIIAKRASLADFQPRFFNRVAFKELGYEIHGHKTQAGLIERAKSVNLPKVAAELESLDRFWREETDEWLERHRFGGFLKSDPDVAEVAAWDDEVIRIQDELDALAADQEFVRCEGGLRRSEELASFEEEAKADGRAFYPELVPAYVGDARFLRRGDVLEPVALVPRGTPEFFASPLPGLAGSGRLQLAEWLTKSDSLQSSLLARAAANRVWQNLFGKALCRTPKELGRLGATPEMPELIDGLAAQLIASGWSLKSLVRTIVTSEAYMRASVVGQDSILPHKNPGDMTDPHNRYFAHQNVRRLQAEPIMNTFATLRDGVRHVTPMQRDSKLSSPRDFLTNFDGPSTDDIMDRRTESISATQALFLMNAGSAYNAITSGLGDRQRTDDRRDLSSMLGLLYLEVLGRPPTEADRDFAESFVMERRRDSGGENHVGEIRDFIHLLLCSNELLYLE